MGSVRRRLRPPPPPPGEAHGFPARFFVHDATLRPARPDAPPLRSRPDERGAFQRRSSLTDDVHVEVLVRAPWADGPCAFVLARSSKEPWLGAFLPETRVWLAPLIITFVAMLAAMGPVVHRLRRLTAEVERTASALYRPGIHVSGAGEIGHLARAFEAARREIRVQLAEKDRREQALRDFIADTTQDVMLPLTVLQGHRVADDGPGIPAEALSRLLARGARGDEARTRAPGLALGRCAGGRW